MRFLTRMCLVLLLASVSASAKPTGKKTGSPVQHVPHAPAKPSSGTGHKPGKTGSGVSNKPPAPPHHATPSTGSSPRI